VPHIGKRGRVLLFFGGLDVVYAVSLAAPDVTTRRAPMFVWLAEIAPLWVWAFAWGGVGAVCLWQALCRRDGIGYAAAIGLKIAWGVVCLGGWLLGGVDRGYVSAAIWLGLAYFVSVVAGWPEPEGERGPTWTRPSQPL
jgi:hypothetical protein